VITLLGPGHYDAMGADDDGDAPIAAVLSAWAGHIAYAYPAVHRDRHGTAHTEPCDQAWPAAGRTITSWCAWLTAYLPYALNLPAAAGLHQDIGGLVHRLRGLTHAEPRTHPCAAPCPACGAFALARTDGRWHVHCTVCAHTLTPEAYAEHAAAVLHTHQTTSHDTAA